MCNSDAINNGGLSITDRNFGIKLWRNRLDADLLNRRADKSRFGAKYETDKNFLRFFSENLIHTGMNEAIGCIAFYKVFL